MRKLIPIISILLFAGNFCKAQYVDITDPLFANFLHNKYPGCFNASWQLDTTCTAITSEDSLEITFSDGSIDGLQYFDNLVYLYVHTSNVWYFPTNFYWPAGIRYLNISSNGLDDLSALPPLPAGLDTLIIKSQRRIITQGGLGPFDYPCLTNLGALPPNLKYLDCSGNSLLTTGTLPNSLTWLDCSNNFTLLTTGPMGLVPLPKLSYIPNLPPGLTYLKCDNNALSSLPAMPVSLTYLNCSLNKFFFYYDDGLGGGTNYQNPGISNITLPANLSYANFSANNITCVPSIPAGLDTLYASGNPINCLPHSLPGIVNDMSSLPLCNPVNNSHACARYSIISGKVFYDMNNNGSYDPGELPKAHVRAQLDNGMYSFSNDSGYYEFTAYTGNHTITIDPPVYYDAIPSSFVHTVNTQDTLITDYVALQPNTFFDSLTVTVFNNGFVRPGFDLESYYVMYENAGTTVLNPVVRLDYDQNKINYFNSTNPAVSDNGTTLQLAVSNFSPFQTGAFGTQFNLLPSTVIGDEYQAIAGITGGTSSCYDTTNTSVIASFDPNIKQATISLTREQVQAGKYIDYTIQFQNTGTAEAVNVVVADTLSSLLLFNSLQLIATMHNCKLTQDNNRLYFEFLNIHLPDSSSNQQGSHGYIRFRVKPQTNLPDNTTIQNRASIYFDFNAPVVTNTATTIVNLVPVPVTLSDFNAKKQNNSVQLSWTTAQEINSKAFIVERSTDQRTWNIITSVNAAGNSSSARNYTATDSRPVNGMNYYRLKSVDLDNKFSYSAIRPVYFGDDLHVIVAPNPVKEKMNVYLPGNIYEATIRIYNLNGQVVKQHPLKYPSTEINITELPNGLYMVRVNGKGINQAEKLIVNH